MAERTLDLAAIRARLESGDGPEYWRSLEELAETPAFRERLQREFPAGRRAMARPGQPSPIPASDGRLARARGGDRLHAPAA